MTSAQAPGRTDALLIVVALTAVSTSGPLIAAAAVPAMAISFWRNAMASGVLIPYALLRCRDELKALTRRELRTAALAGAFLALHFATWIPSLSMTSVVSATALVATQPIWAALIARFRGEGVGRQVWVGIGVAMTGALLLAATDLDVSGEALRGDLLAVVGGAFAAAYMTAGGEVRRSVSTTTYTTLCYSVTALILLIVSVVSGQDLSGYDSDDWFKLVALTAGAQLLGHSLFNVVLRSVSATLLSLTILMEIPGAALIAYVFLDQEPPALAIPAAALLIAGLALVVRAGTRAGTRVEPSLPVE